jgi:tetratricopeptide (TPR) repeat protein
MADVVLARVEDFLPELQDLEKQELFTQSELKQILKHRTDFEYTCSAKSVTAEHFHKYIQHELAVEMLRRKRLQKRKQAKLPINHNSVSSFSIVRRIHSLYSRLLDKHQGQPEMFHEYLQFCVKSGATKQFNKGVQRALRYHPKDASFWSLYAQRQMALGNIDTARLILIKALRTKCHQLLPIFQKLVDLEIMVTNKTQSSDNQKLIAVLDEASKSLTKEDLSQLISGMYGNISEIEFYSHAVSRCDEIIEEHSITRTEQQSLFFEDK